MRRSIVICYDPVPSLSAAQFTALSNAVVSLRFQAVAYVERGYMDSARDTAKRSRALIAAFGVRRVKRLEIDITPEAHA